MRTYGAEVIAARLDGLDEQATGSRVAVHCTDEILHWRLVGETDEILHVVDNQPGEVLRVVQVLTLQRDILKTILKHWRILKRFTSCVSRLSPHSRRKG